MLLISGKMIVGKFIAESCDRNMLQSVAAFCFKFAHNQFSPYGTCSLMGAQIKENMQPSNEL